MDDTKATKGAPAKRRGVRGRKPDPRKPARDRFVFAVMDWLMHSPYVKRHLAEDDGPAALEAPIGYSDEGSGKPWAFSERWTKAWLEHDWDNEPAVKPVATSLRGTSHLLTPAVRTMGGAPGMAAYLLQRYVPRSWCNEAPLTLLHGPRLQMKPELAFTIKRLWTMYHLRLAHDSVFFQLAHAAGVPEPIILQPSTIAEVYKRMIAAGCQGLIVEKYAD